MWFWTQMWNKVFSLKMLYFVVGRKHGIGWDERLTCLLDMYYLPLKCTESKKKMRLGKIWPRTPPRRRSSWQRLWWFFCQRNTWFRSRRWSTTARSSWTSTTSWAKWRSFRREPFLHLSIKQQSVHISYRVQSDLDRRESLQPTYSVWNCKTYLLQNVFKVSCFVHSYDFKESINIKYHSVR